MNSRDLEGCSPMEKLIEQLPDVASLVLDRCITCSGLPASNPDLTIDFNFEFLDPEPDAEVTSGSESYFGPAVMAKHHQENLLNHTLTQTLLQWKWLSLGKFPFYLNFWSFQFFVGFFTVFIVTERQKTSLLGAGHGNATKVNLIQERTTFSAVMPILLFVFAMLHHIRIIYYFVLLKLGFFRQWSHVVDLSLYISTLLFLLPYVAWSSDLYAEPTTQWSAGTVALFFTYLNEILYIRRLRTAGIYVTMYFNVLTTFLKVISIFMVFIIGFALLNYVLLKEQVRSLGLLVILRCVLSCISFGSIVFIVFCCVALFCAFCGIVSVLHCILYSIV